MNIPALLLAIVGALIAAFYALESVLYFQTNGFGVPLIAKVAICAVGIYFCGRNLKRIKGKQAVLPGAEA